MSNDPAEAMRDLRCQALTLPLEELGQSTAPEFPRVLGVIVDWPIRSGVATIVGFSSGDASVYTTGTFGVIGGIAHSRVRDAAKTLVKTAESFYDDAASTSNFEYPTPDYAHFYLRGAGETRVIVADLSSVATGKDSASPLFGAAHELLAELRKVAESIR